MFDCDISGSNLFTYQCIQQKQYIWKILHIQAMVTEEHDGSVVECYTGSKGLMFKIHQEPGVVSLGNRYTVYPLLRTVEPEKTEKSYQHD